MISGSSAGRRREVAVVVISAAAAASAGCCEALAGLLGPSKDLDARYSFVWEVEQKRYTDVWYDRSDDCIGSTEASARRLTEKSRTFVCQQKVCGKVVSPTCSFDCDAKIKMIERKCEDVPAKDKAEGGAP